MLAYGGNGLYVVEGDSWRYEPVEVSDIYVVNENLAYGTLLIGEPGLVYYDGSSWGPFPGEPLPYNVEHVWANEDSIFCAGDSGLVLSLEDESWVVHDTGTISRISALWGFSVSDVWAATYHGEILHWDGTNWEMMDWPSMGDDSSACNIREQRIEGMWGIDGYLFIHTTHEFFMWDGIDFTVIAYWPGEETGELPDECSGDITINAIWGNSENEVFLAVSDDEHASRLCGQEEYLLWWDGSHFHWF